MDDNNKYEDWACLLALGIVIRVLAYFVLRFVAKPKFKLQ
jgi:hypothetical protein